MSSQDVRNRKVSVITPAFNAEEWIVEVLVSIASQGDAVLEHIVVDDGSTDSTSALVQSFASENGKIHLIQQKNAGEASAVNRGLIQARGEFAMIVNADDPLLPGAVLELSRVLTESPQAVVVYPNWLKISASGEIVERVSAIDYSERLLIADFMCLPGPGTAFRRTEEGNSFLLRNRQFVFVSDYDYWLRMSLRGKFVHLPKTLATWRKHVDSASTRAAGQALAKESLLVIETFFANRTLPTEIRKFRSQARSMSQYFAATQKCIDPKVPGRRLMLRSLLTPFTRAGYQPHYRRNPLTVLQVLLHPWAPHRHFTSKFRTRRSQPAQLR